jgi:Protein of unknown function (DUF3631)
MSCTEQNGTFSPNMDTETMNHDPRSPGDLAAAMLIASPKNPNAERTFPSSTLTIAGSLDEISDLLDKHLVITPQQACIVTLWIAHTYKFHEFQHTPRLAITAPEKQCGKSTLLNFLGELVSEPHKTDNITAASMFRRIEANPRVTFLIDEADTFLVENTEMRNVINSGFERPGSVTRNIRRNSEWVPADFSTFCPVAIAGIGSLPATIADRAIPISLKRRAHDEKVERLQRGDPILKTLKEQLLAWGQSTDLADHMNPDIPTALSDRQGDISIPLLAIADGAGGEWPQKAREALLAVFITHRANEDTAGIGSTLLADIRDIFAIDGQDFLPSKTICKLLEEKEGRLWPDYDRGKPINPNHLARLLAPFEIRPTNKRTEKGVLKGYWKSDFEDAWRRYTQNGDAPF